MEENVDEHQKAVKDATNLVRIHTHEFLSLNQNACFALRSWMDDRVNAFCTVVVSKYVHDRHYAHALVEEIERLSRGNRAEKAFAVALANMVELAGNVVPDTVEKIPSEFQGSEIKAIAAQIGYGCSILNEPLSTFVFGASAPDITLDIEYERRINERDIAPKKACRFSTEANLAIAGISGAAIAGLMASGAKDSPSLRAFAATSGIGFTSSFLAAHTGKRPKLSEFLSKVGAIGTASAVTVALGNTINTVMFGDVNVNALVISLICVINAAIVIFGN